MHGIWRRRGKAQRMESVEKEVELPEHGLKRTLKDLFAGAVGGVAQVLLGMCF